MTTGSAMLRLASKEIADDAQRHTSEGPCQEGHGEAKPRHNGWTLEEIRLSRWGNKKKWLGQEDLRVADVSYISGSNPDVSYMSRRNLV